MSNTFAIKNVRIITDCEEKSCSTVIVRDGRTEKLTDTLPEGFEGRVIDGKNNFLTAGFIDIHCHGGGGHDFMDATPEAFVKACETHAMYGTTSILPTTLAGEEDELCKSFEAFHEAKKLNKNGAQMLGMHLEGPYFSKEFKGAQDEKYIVSPKREQYERIFERSEGAIVRWSAAPELPGSHEFAQFLKEKGILASAAHTSATYEQMKTAFEDGFTLITHLYSGMSTIVRIGGFRVPGVVESAYLIDDISAELIADGCHLPPSLLQLAYKCKGADRLVLVTDSMRGAGMTEGESILGSLKNGQTVYIEKGVAFMPDRTAFAGSICTADRLVRTMYKSAGISLPEAVKMITENPAKLIKCDDRKGRVKEGFDADFVLFDEDINIEMTVIGGREVYVKSDVR